MRRHDTLELIGRTPLVALKKLSPPGSLIWAKAEIQNPGGTVKDRAAHRARPVRKPKHVLQGTGYGTVPPHWDPALADTYLMEKL